MAKPNTIISFLLFRKNKTKLQPTPPTGEELFIQNYLDDELIHFKREYKISNLKGDTKSYRIADFYLTWLNVYVEYFGMYNSTKQVRNEYDKKVEVYLKNHIPTVILYPHELGFLDYTFHRKILSVLRIPKFKKRHRLFLYKLNRYRSKGRSYYLLISIASLILAGLSGSAEETLTPLGFYYWLMVIFVAITLISLMHFFVWIANIFFYDY